MTTSESNPLSFATRQQRRATPAHCPHCGKALPKHDPSGALGAFATALTIIVGVIFLLHNAGAVLYTWALSYSEPRPTLVRAIKDQVLWNVELLSRIW
jgi:hypothetical protein